MCLMLVCTSFNINTDATETFNLDVNQDGAIDVLDVITLKNNLVSNNTTDTDTYTNLLYLKKYILKWSYYASTTTVTTTTTPEPVTEPIEIPERYKTLDEYIAGGYQTRCGYNTTSGMQFGATESQIYEMDEIYNNFFDLDWTRQRIWGYEGDQVYWDWTYDRDGGHREFRTGDWYLDDAMSHITSISGCLFGTGADGTEDNAYIAMTGNGVDCGGSAQWWCYMLYKSGYATRYCDCDSQNHAWFEVWNGSEWLPFNTVGSYYPDDAQYLTVYIPEKVLTN